jgi:hypothetical protein
VDGLDSARVELHYGRNVPNRTDKNRKRNWPNAWRSLGEQFAGRPFDGDGDLPKRRAGVAVVLCVEPIGDMRLGQVSLQLQLGGIYQPGDRRRNQDGSIYGGTPAQADPQDVGRRGALEQPDTLAEHQNEQTASCSSA